MFLRRAILAGLLLGHTFGYLALPGVSQAVSHSLVISEVQMAGSGSGHSSEEFVELYNATESTINLDKWTLKYHSNSNADCSSGWSTKYTASNVSIAPHGFWLIASTAFSGFADGRFTAGLASIAGAVRVVDGSAAVIDAVGWGVGDTCAEGSAIAAISDGRSIERRPGEDQPFAGNSVDTDDNSADMIMRTIPEPQSSLSVAEAPSVVENFSNTQTVYLPLEVTELLIDPISPANDAQDEYIEIHNPNPEPVQLSGYTLKTSNSSYHLLPAVLNSNEFIVIMAGASHLSLANTGGTLELDDPAGSAIDIVAPWPVAIPGAAWALIDDAWRWTSHATPAALNIFADIEVATSNTVGVPHSGDYLPLRLSEVFPDPEAPLTDANDEFVEIYNPNSIELDMGGYQIKTGTNLGNSVILPSGIIPAGGYAYIKSSDTALTLSNSGSNVQLLDPAGTQQDTTSYGEAKTGQSWAFIDGAWSWTSSPTLGEANILTIDSSLLTSSKTAASASQKAKSLAVKAVKTAKITAPKVKAASTKKASSSSKPLVASSNIPGSNRWLLFVLAGLTIAYIIYEFRYDIRNYYNQLRRYAASRR